MGTFSMEIAGHTASVTALFESTPQYFRAYLSHKAPEFSIQVTPEDLVSAQAALLAEAHREGFRPRVFTDPFLERICIQNHFAEFLFDFDILLFHGSAIAVDGAGYLFTANSGTGKSTHTRLWRQMLGQRAVMINDDQPFLAVRSEGVWLYGAPWSGKHGLDSNICVPLRGICVLTRGERNHIEQATPAQLLPMLQKQCRRSADAKDFDDLVEALSRQVPLWQMACNREPEAAEMAFRAMRAGEPTKKD